MDTHGLFDHEVDHHSNAMLATFSTLISSLQIFNVKEQISKEVLDHLEVCHE